MTLSNLDVIFADFHVFKLWGLDQQPALLIGMDLLGVLERLVIDYRRNEVSMYGERARRASSSAELREKVTPARGSRAILCFPMATPEPTPVREWRDISAATFRDEIQASHQPAVIRGAVRDWPAVHAGLEPRDRSLTTCAVSTPAPRPR
jgi:hypothetical protein